MGVADAASNSCGDKVNELNLSTRYLLRNTDELDCGELHIYKYM